MRYVPTGGTCGGGGIAFPQKHDSVINVKVKFGEGKGKVPLDNIAKRAETYKPKERVTYKMIQEYIEDVCYLMNTKIILMSHFNLCQLYANTKARG